MVDIFMEFFIVQSIAVKRCISVLEKRRDCDFFGDREQEDIGDAFNGARYVYECRVQHTIR
jgi:hypothetical protein